MMKKMFTVIFVSLLIVSGFSFNQNQVKAESTLAVEFVPKSFSVLWNDFATMLDGTYQNKYTSVLTWNPIETSKIEFITATVNVTQIIKICEGKYTIFGTHDN